MGGKCPYALYYFYKNMFGGRNILAYLGQLNHRMKILYTAAFILLLSACKQAPKLELTVKADGVSNGVVQLKQANQLTFNETIKNGSVSTNQQLQAPGYYKLSVIDNNKPITSNTSYDIYLENGNYTVQTNPAKPLDYPTVTTTSATQNELTAYYQMLGSTAGALDYKIDSLTRYLQSNAVAAMPKEKRAALYASTRDVQKERRQLDLKTLGAYMEKNPKSTIGAHIMYQVYYPEYAKEYSVIFQKFPNEVQLSDDGLKIRNKLGSLLSQMNGGTAPEIVGSAPNGAPFNKQAINKKITLIEFWRPENETSELMHQQLVKGIILTPADRANFDVVTVAITAKDDAWIDIVKKDKKPWQQVSDLKGDESPNVTNWEIKKLPTFCLVDKNWKMIKSNVAFGEIDTEVHDYLMKH